LELRPKCDYVKPKLARRLLLTSHEKQMIRYLKQIYLTEFAIIFRLSRARDIAYKAGGAVAAITVVEWFFIEGLRGYVDIFLNKATIFAKPVVLIAFFGLFFINGYVLFFRRHGIKFAHEFGSLKKSRKVLLVSSCAVLSVAAIVFGIYSAVAHRHFIGADVR
jgi:hypothetical protein